MEALSDDDENETLLFNLVYCSRAVDTFKQDELERLVSAAQKHNAEESITGWLVYSHGIFFQWLEGERAKVERLMTAISADPRHDTIVVLSDSEEIRDRMFSGWDMELVSADDIRAVLMDAMGAADDAKHKDALRSLLKDLDAKSVGTLA